MANSRSAAARMSCGAPGPVRVARRNIEERLVRRGSSQASASTTSSCRVTLWRFPSRSAASAGRFVGNPSAVDRPFQPRRRESNDRFTLARRIRASRRVITLFSPGLAAATIAIWAIGWAIQRWALVASSDPCSWDSHPDRDVHLHLLGPSSARLLGQAQSRDECG